MMRHKILLKSEFNPKPKMKIGSRGHALSNWLQGGSRRSILKWGIFGFILVTLALLFTLNVGTRSENKIIQGQVALSESELKETIKTRHLVVFWTGPSTNDKYALTVKKSGEIFIRYLPDGKGLNDSGNKFRTIGTYVLQDAFSKSEKLGFLKKNVGFINVDGNAVFYAKNRPQNVFMGIRNMNIQVEIYDPGIDQALGAALIQNKVIQID